MKKKFIIEQLEERLMLSADFLPVPFDGGLPYDEGTADLPVVETSLFPNASESHNVENAELQRHELVFIDSRVPEYQKLVDDITAQQSSETHIEVIVLDGNRDGIEQISQTLNQYANIDAVHLFSHGSDGAVQLGNTWLTLDTLDTYADSIEGWKNSLTGDADLLFYGCDVAAGEDGRVLVESLSILTGADIAASDDLTGIKELGGDWELEVTSGRIETIELHASYAWQGILDLVNINAAADTYIDKNSSPNNFGNSPSLIVDHSGGDIGDQRILMQFDLSGVPAGSTITGATLKMNATGNTGAFDINIYALTEAWVEGTGDDTSGVASWDQRQSGTNWTTAGGDYDDLTIYSTLNTTAFGQHTWDITSLVQAWYGSTIANHGLIIGSPDGGGDSVTYDSDEKGTGIRPVLEINYTPPAGNTQPILDNSANMALNSVAEDASVPSLGDGTLISALVDLVDGSGHDNVTDPDSGAVTGIALTNVDTSNGTWYYSTDNGNNWALISDVVDPATIGPSNAFMLAADGSTRIYFRPNAEYNGTISNAIRFRAWDQTDGLTSGDIADTTLAGAYSSAQEQADITVDPVNDAPVVTAPGSALSATEQTALDIHGPAMFSVSDADAVSSGVMATLSVGEGTLTIAEGDSGVIINGDNGTGTVVISGTISQINALLTGAGTGTITYLNSSETPSASTTLTVTVNDLGNTGTDPGLTGNATSEEGSNNVTINITAVNDDPTLVNPIADQNATEDAAFNFTFAANTFNDVDAGDTVTYTATLVGGAPLPAWLSFDGATRTFSGTPANGDVGTISVEVTADDGNLGTPATDQFDITVGNTNDDPTVANPIADQNATEDAAFNFTFAANTFNEVDVGDTLTYTATLVGGAPLPAWLSFDGVTRTFSGTPANGDVGTISVEVTADDGNLGTPATDQFDITVGNTNDDPTVANPIADQNATEDAAFNFTFAANTFNEVDVGDTLTYTATLVGGAPLPAWLSFDGATRTFSGTPANGDVGTISVEVTADDGNLGTPATDQFDITVGNTNDDPTVANPIADQNATEDAAFNFTFAANTFNEVDVGDTLTYTATLVGGAPLPAWLSFDGATRTFSGTPANGDVGTISVEVTADDGNLGTPATDQFDITVGNTNDDPTVANPIADQNATEDAAFNFTFAANTFNEVDAGDTLTYTATLVGGAPLPAWLSFDGATRTFSGTPANGDVGTISVEVTADDGNLGTPATDQFDITVGNTNDDPVIGGVDTGSVTEDVDPDADGLLETSGSMTITDADIGDDHFAAGTIAGTYGSVTIDAAGNWTYTADNSLAAIQQLGSGNSMSDTITVTTKDGTTHDIVITINGADDAPVIGGIDTGTVTEDIDPDSDGLLETSGRMTITDADIGDGQFAAGTITGTYGSATIDAAGNWTYSADNSLAAIQQLGLGNSMVDKLTVTTKDGTTHDIFITINGTNDAPVVSATASDTGSEDMNKVYTHAELLTLIGAADADMDDDLTITISNVVHGTLNLSGGTGGVGTIFTFSPDADFFGNMTFNYQLSDEIGASSAVGTASVALNPVADTPQAGNTATLPDTLSDPIVISPNTSDGIEVTHFQITGITNGTLYHADGITPITNGDFITITQAQDGLKFQLASYTANGSFNVRPSKNGFSVDLDSGSATPIITVLSSSTVPDAGDTGDEPAEDDQEIKEETIADNPLNDATGNNATLSYNTAQKKSFITSDASVPKSGVYESQVTVDFKPIMERLSRIQENDSSNILSALSLEQQFNNIINKLPDFRTSYENLKNALDDFRKEADVEMQNSETVIGSAIAVSTGLSVGYVIWMIRGGMLLSSLISSMPAWQLADPLPILKNSNNDEDDEDDESLESIIKKSSDNDDKKKQGPDKTGI